MACPRECEQDRMELNKKTDDLFVKINDRTLPGWIMRALVAATLGLFSFYAASWAYGAVTYVTKDELRTQLATAEKDRGRMRDEMRETRQEILSEIRSLRQDLKK